MKRRNESEEGGDAFQGVPNKRQCEDSEGTSFESTLLSAINTTENLAGKIECLQMVNFMCHSNLELKFNSRVNFITGRNGSGKSAIMAALVVVLGGSAALTNRASGITDFIKKGEHWAKVAITLTNEGTNAFRREVYGSRIVIIRNLSSSGRHGYVCKSEGGSVVSKKKEEVESIVVSLNLQIKNPICVLNQDVARTFLCATDSSLRFSMFMKATQLEQLKNIYVKTLELLVTSKKHLSVKQKGIEEASKEIGRLKEKLELFASLEKRIREKTDLENEYFWSLVGAEEAKVKELRRRREELVGKREECVREEEDLESVREELEREVKEWEKRIEEGRKEKKEKEEEKLKVEKSMQSLEREMEKGEAQLKVVQGKMERQLADIRSVKEHLRENESMASQSHGEKERAKAKMEALRRKLSEVREEVGRAQGELRRAEEEQQEQTKRVEAMKADLGELEQNKRRLEVLLAGSKVKGQNNYMKFGHFTQELVQAIEESAKKNSFHRKPIGPCGLHVSLTGDPKWARAVESVIGGLMTIYRCDNQKDFQVLKAIMERVCGKTQPTVIIGKFLRSRHNIESKKVVLQGFKSVLDVLSFDNDVVFNTFIDQARIETILLFETDQQAASILTNVQNVPKNLKMGLTLQSDVYFPAPRYRTYHGNPKRPLRYLDAMSKGGDSVKRLEGELKDVSRAVVEKSSEVGRGREGLREGWGVVERWKKRLKDLKHEEGRVQVELNQVKDIEETQPVAITRVALEEELEGLERRRREVSGEVERCRGVVEGLRESWREWGRRLEGVVAGVGEVERAVRGWEEALEEKKSKQRKVVSRRRGMSEAMEEVKRKLRKVDEELERGREAVEERVRAAEEICARRIETDKSPREVQVLLEKCERYLKAAEKMTGSREATIAEYKTKRELFKVMKKMAGLLEKAIETMVMAAFKKEKRLSVLQSHTSSLVSFYFQAMLQTRGYDGQLKVDFENKVLDLEVKTKEATVARKDSKTLSGGERSYSTVSFILAIWKVVHMPVYFLDEFDVFMDKVNRKVIMELLLEHANAQTNKQFVFITPLDISGVQPSDVISVFKLPDPERRKK